MAERLKGYGRKAIGYDRKAKKPFNSRKGFYMGNQHQQQ